MKYQPRMKRRAIAVTVMACMLCMSWAGGAYAAVPAGSAVEVKDAQAAVSELRYVALGDSLTVGFEPQLLKEKNPVPYGFVDRVLEQALYKGRAKLSNYGILGLTSEGLRIYVKAIQSGQAFKYADLKSVVADPRAASIEQGIAQAKADIEQADVITITIGGNDFGALLNEMSDLADDKANGLVDRLIEQYTLNVTETVKMLKAMNPKAKIIIADQYQPLPKYQREALYQKLMAVADQFTSTIDGMAKALSDDGTEIKVAHVAELFKGREGELTHTNLMEQDIHPTQKGYELMAKSFAESIWGSYRVPKPDSTGATTIVVKGQEIVTKNLPTIRNNRTFVAIKDIVDAMGATSKWDNKTLTATIFYGDRVLTLPIGSKSASVNGQPLVVDAPAFLLKVGKEQKTYVPLRLLADGLGFQIENRTKAHTVFINP
ncbi:stalk domain-containing protein [Paenibacillus terrigena]|uniref:stalk domain-containing protein n=1 Tax=Paenibacillus terrigena TaxID=369333 RepID=UPI000378403D|nr:stalk domain-containing protein [Paenibacillus terrigena]